MPWDSARRRMATKLSWQSGSTSDMWVMSAASPRPHDCCMRMPPIVKTGIEMSVRPKRRRGTCAGGTSAPAAAAVASTAAPAARSSSSRAVAMGGVVWGARGVGWGGVGGGARGAVAGVVVGWGALVPASLLV